MAFESSATYQPPLNSMQFGDRPITTAKTPMAYLDELNLNNPDQLPYAQEIARTLQIALENFPNRFPSALSPQFVKQVINAGGQSIPALGRPGLTARYACATFRSTDCIIIERPGKTTLPDTRLFDLQGNRITPKGQYDDPRYTDLN